MTTCAQCPNDARYVCADSVGRCGIHAIGMVAARAADVPEVLSLVHLMLEELDGSPILPDLRARLRDLISYR